MFRAIKLLIEIFWVMDILDLPFMEIFDTKYPLNGLFWIATIILLVFEEAQEKDRQINFNFVKK